MTKKMKLTKIISLLFASSFIGISLLFLTSCTIATDNNIVNKPVPPNNPDEEISKPSKSNEEPKPPINKPNDIENELPSIEFEKSAGNGIVRTKYSTNSYIKSRYSRTLAETYTNNELKELWGEDKYDINDFPHPSNANAHSFSKDRYKSLIKRYGSSFNSNDENKEPMMNPLSLINMVSNNKIKKHHIADYQYGTGNLVSDDTLAVEKVFNIDINQKDNISTGLFLLLDEIIEISIANL